MNFMYSMQSLSIHRSLFLIQRMTWYAAFHQLLNSYLHLRFQILPFVFVSHRIDPIRSTAFQLQWVVSEALKTLHSLHQVEVQLLHPLEVDVVDLYLLMKIFISFLKIAVASHLPLPTLTLFLNVSLISFILIIYALWWILNLFSCFGFD